jgi:glycosyltransferase involved in cell wall biosynthesis
MKVLFDLIYLEKEKHGGISRMWIEYFKKIYKSKSEVTFIGNSKSNNIAISYLKSINFCDSNLINKPYMFGSFFSKIFQLNIVNSFLLIWQIPKNVDIFHSTGYSNPLFKRKDLKIITTIHDMVFWDQKKKMKKGISYWDNVWGIYHSLRVSDRIITVSNSSKKSIIKHFPWAEKKIEVIYHGLPLDFLKVKIKIKKEKYFMFIGGRNDYKNYDLLLDSFSLFAKDNPEWKLCVVGQNDQTINFEKEKYKKLNISSNVKDYGLVDQDKIINLIKNAAAIIIPSLNEGFNFPLLEGMACGTPVLSSKIPVSKEIGKNYVSYFDNNKKSLFQHMLIIKNNSIDQHKLIKARKYAQCFNWDNSYRKLTEVYNSCT